MYMCLMFHEQNILKEFRLKTIVICKSFCHTVKPILAVLSFNNFNCMLNVFYICNTHSHNKPAIAKQTKDSQINQSCNSSFYTNIKCFPTQPRD